ncbi:MAG: C40 family peptidase, partial [Fibrobacterota bacterium]
KAGAPAEASLEMMEASFSSDISDSRIITSSFALKKARELGISAEIYYDVISYGVYEGWDRATLYAVFEGIELAGRKGFSREKAALALTVRFARGTDGELPESVMKDEISRLGRMRAYGTLEDAVSAGVNPDVAKEVYRHGVLGGWSAEALQEVMKGLARGVKKGLTQEKLALALVVRMDSGLKVSPEQMVKEEIEYISGLEGEKERTGAVKKDQELKRRIESPVKEKAPPARGGLNVSLLRSSVMSFYNYPTPYRWGGTKRGGADCSGFVQTCYREQGIEIPRVSRFQYSWLKEKGGLMNRDGLRLGDLVFFNSSGYGRISHVGIFWGNKNGKRTFVHSCSSKGVTFTPLDKPYYIKRFVGAGRVTD